jgi:hypothetical protein
MFGARTPKPEQTPREPVRALYESGFWSMNGTAYLDIDGLLQRSWHCDLIPKILGAPDQIVPARRSDESDLCLYSMSRVIEAEPELYEQKRRQEEERKKECTDFFGNPKNGPMWPKLIGPQGVRDFILGNATWPDKEIKIRT